MCYCRYFNLDFVDVAPDIISLGPVQVYSVYMIGMTELFSFHGVVTDKINSWYPSHVALPKTHKDILELPRLSGCLDGAIGEILSTNIEDKLTMKSHPEVTIDDIYRSKFHWLTR